MRDMNDREERKRMGLELAGLGCSSIGTSRERVDFTMFQGKSWEELDSRLLKVKEILVDCGYCTITVKVDTYYGFYEIEAVRA